MIAKDMTVGSPTRLLIGFTLPLMVGNLFQQFYNMADSIIVGKGIGVDAFAAVGATGWVSFLILGFVTGLTSGFGILTAQRFGAGDAEGLRHTLTQGTIQSIFIGVIFTIISMTTSMPLLKLLNTPDSIIEDANTYLLVIYAGTLATVMYNFYASIIRALGNTRGPLYVLVISAVVNVVLDIIFVVPLQMGVGGAALATVISQVLSAVLCYLILRKYPILRTTRRDWKFLPSMQKRLFLLGIPMALQNSIIAIGGIILQAVINGYGSVYVAGFTAASRVQNLAEQPALTLGLAMATYAGQNLGAGKIERIRHGLRNGVWISLIVTVVLGAVMIIFRRPIITLFVDSSETDVLDAAGLFLTFMGGFEWILGFLFVYRSTLQGMGNTLIPMISGGVELAMRVIIALTLPALLGFLGICLAEVAAWTGAALLLAASCYIIILKKCRQQSQ